jgi:hypothetical protein
MLADAYTKTGFTNYILRYEYSAAEGQFNEFGFDISTWANTVAPLRLRILTVLRTTKQAAALQCRFV